MDKSILAIIIVIVILIIIGVIILSCKCTLVTKKMIPSIEITSYQNTQQMDRHCKTNAQGGKHKQLKKRRSNPNSTYGPSGLKNTKATFNINAMIQAMASSNVLITKYEDILNKCSNKKESPKLRKFISLLKNINSPKDRKGCLQKNTATLKGLIERINLKKESQEDIFQLWSTFINEMQKDIKDEMIKQNITMPPKFKVLNSFTECSDYNKVQDHLVLELPLCGDFRSKSGVKLNTLMDRLFESSAIDGSTYKTQISLFERAPDILILNIQANEWDDDKGAYIKPQYYIRYKDKIAYEFNIHMEKDGSKMEKVKVVYKLTAVVHLMGTISGGHFITFRTHKKDWYFTNDEQVERIHFLYDIVPYVMVYEKEYK